MLKWSCMSKHSDDRMLPPERWDGLDRPKRPRKIVDCVAPDRTPQDLIHLQEKLEACTRTFTDKAEEFRILASENRLKILALLECAGELCVCDLAAVLDISPAAVSQHLSRLRSAGFVRSRRAGMTTYYSLARDPWPTPPREPILDEEGSEHG